MHRRVFEKPRVYIGIQKIAGFVRTKLTGVGLKGTVAFDVYFSRSRCILGVYII